MITLTQYILYVLTPLSLSLMIGMVMLGFEVKGLWNG